MDDIPCYDGERSAGTTAVARGLSGAKVGSRSVVERSDEMMYHKTTAKAGWCCILKPLSKEQCRVSHAHSCLSFCLHLLTQFFLFSLLYPAPLLPPPRLKLLSQMHLQLRKLILITLSTAPTPHIPGGPVSRLIPLAPLFKRKLIHAHKETRIKTQIVLFVLQTRALHVHRQDVDVHVVHARVGVHAYFDLGRPIAPW
jgi:hypothetical protein